MANVDSQETAKDILLRTLSLGVDSPATSATERMCMAGMEDVAHHELRDIGRGTCGSVFEVPGTACAIKKGANTAAIWNDFNLTNRAYNSCRGSVGSLEHVFAGRRVPGVPLARNFNGPGADVFWTENMARFPEGDRTRAAVFHLDRIWPVPETTRRALVRRFFQEDESSQRDVLENPENADCLVRVYLGKNRRSDSRRYDRTDTLRNFPLHLDEAEEIGLDVGVFAQEMAMGLAILHWRAGIDAQDTEFVIGLSTTARAGTVYSNQESVHPPVSTVDDCTRRETRLWMLDYDKCSKVDLDFASVGSLLDMEVVDKYLVAVTGNDPYFPHPRLDVGLWRSFRDAYLQASEVVIDTNRRKRQLARLPGMLMERWERWGDMDVEAQEFDPFERSPEDDEEETEGEGDDDSSDDEDE